MKTDGLQNNTLRERLVWEGINELNEVGYERFSLRHVAERCKVSCAAPYRHFSDKDELIAAIMDYVSQQWMSCANHEAEIPDRSTRDRLVAISMAYIRFLRANPKFRAIIMQSSTSKVKQMNLSMVSLSAVSQEMINRYCEEVRMPREIRDRKVFVIRSLIYGAALMLDNGEIQDDEETLNMIKQTLDREFDLP